jgi:hypothetical protein
LGNLQAFALNILVTWMPFILVMPCLGIWAILIRRELDNSDCTAAEISASPTHPEILPLDRTGAGKDRFKEAGSLWADNPRRRS